jgi:hypothetical protein
MTKFRASDAWLLYSVINAGKGWVQLKDVSATGDFVMHSIFNFDQVREGVTRLTAEGLLDVRETKLRPTPEADRLWKKAIPSFLADSQFDKLKKLEKLLIRETRVDREGSTAPGQHGGITEQDFRTAVDAYLKETNEIIQKSFQKRR